ncbi:MAG: 4Fe-4S dicluster domain-containing protein [Bacteroidales bacterium]|nr:4Fe-4S dicluster domain-containing protein [Bacteroidales bacterium]
MLRKIRITMATLSMLCITLLFLDFTGVLHHWLGWLAKVQFVPAILALNFAVIAILVVLTFIFGRIYCSVICPLGIMQDIMARLRFKKKKHQFTTEKKWLRYPILILFIVAMVCGFGAFWVFLEPYGSFGRIASNLLQPIYLWLNNILAGIAEHYESYMFYDKEIWIRSLPTFIVAAATFFIISAMAINGGRTYCNTICPVGTVLGFVSRFSLFGIRIDKDKCKQCGACVRKCKSSCIDVKTMTVDYSRCVVCGNCTGNCKFGALHYGMMTKSSHNADETSGKDNKNDNVDDGRRAFLTGSVMLATTAALAQTQKKVDGGLAVIEDKISPVRNTPITPPGSLSARNFQQRCTACQLCVAECPNQVLVPSTDLTHFMQPTMSYDKGYCRSECNRCSQVCPTGAIRPISQEEKTSIQIGHAVWVKKNCLPATEGISCGNCARHCPTGAIQMIPSDPNDESSPLIPAVNTAVCIGCGACENLCPANPSAIYVEGHEQHREI